MLSPPVQSFRGPDRGARLTTAVAAVLLAAVASAQTQQNTVPPLPQNRPNSANQSVQAPAPAQLSRAPANGVRSAPAAVNARQYTQPQQQQLQQRQLQQRQLQQQQLQQQQLQQLRNLLGSGGSINNSQQAQRQGTANFNQVQQNPRNQGSNSVPTSRAAATNPTDTSRAPSRIASLDTHQAPAARAQHSRTFVGHPGPMGSTEIQTPRGMIIRKAADGSVMDVHSPRNGMYIHHGLYGDQRIMVDKPDRSRIVVATNGAQYVQHPYSYRGRQFDQRTFVVQGRLVQRLYRPYTYAGQTLDVYTPSRYYQPEVYSWATTEFKPQPVTWIYTTNDTPWFNYYKGYFTPDSSYTSPVSWLTDYLLAANLADAYKTRASNSTAGTSGASPTITPQVKQKLTAEVGQQVKREAAEARESAQDKLPAGTAGSVVEELSDGQSHVFVVASDLDLVDPNGRRCMISEGDVIEVMSPPKPDTSTAEALVLASKGGLECQRAARVDVALNDLQEMQNHMRETIDQGLANSNAGKKAASVTPAFAAAAPPPDTSAAAEIDRERRIAAETEG
jgi:hypothetical protein